MRWNYYPRNKQIDETSDLVVKAFEKEESKISTVSLGTAALESNDVLALVGPHLEKEGFEIEKGKKEEDLIKVPVLFGEGGVVAKRFLADAYNREKKYVVEVEAGRGYTNNQFLKDFFEACTMVDVTHLCIAVKDENHYIVKGKETVKKDFEAVSGFFDALYTSGRLGIPLEGLLIIGY